MQRPPARPGSFESEIQSGSSAVPEECVERYAIVESLARGSRKNVVGLQQPRDGRQLLQQQQRCGIDANAQEVDAGTGARPPSTCCPMQIQPTAALAAQIPGLFHTFAVIVDLLV